MIVRALLSLPSACFDCASQAEIATVLNSGGSAKNIIFANPMKPAKAIKYALSNKVQTMTFDSVHELQKVNNTLQPCCVHNKTSSVKLLGICDPFIYYYEMSSWTHMNVLFPFLT